MIKIQNQLDFEREKTYYLTVKATDMGAPPLVSMARVNISVLDVNDNTPLFRQISYSTKVYEDVEIGTNVIQVSIIFILFCDRIKDL